MAKSSVERYEQLLSQDPTSAVFVELAKALIAQGELARAIQVCEQGVQHHATSVKGRVLWGKALILQGRPAEAMGQFDQAIAIEKDNPYAYTLIAEVLLQRGLYRSALPILRKASTLAPNDGRVRQWLEQAQAALTGGPAPEPTQFATLETQSEPPSQDEAEEGAAVAPASEPASPAAAQETAPASEPEPMAPAEEPRGGETGAVAAAALPVEPRTEPGGEGTASEEDSGGASRDVEPGPAAPALSGDSDREVMPPGEAALPTEALEAGADAEVTRPAFELPAEVDISLSEETPLPPEAPELEPSVAEEDAVAARGGGLLGDLPSLEEMEEPEAPVALASEALDGEEEPALVVGLLEDIPEPLVDAPKPTEDVPEAAKEEDLSTAVAAYERELRAKLMPGGLGRGRAGMRVAVVVGGLVVLVAAVAGFRAGRANPGGRTSAEALANAERLLARDTRPAFEEALGLLARAIELDAGNARAGALEAYTHALLYAEHGEAADERARALSALGRPGVREASPGLAVAVAALVTDEGGREAARGAVLASTADVPEVHALAGRYLLEGGQVEEALGRWKRALGPMPRRARVLVALGAYYLGAGDVEAARRMYELARQMSPGHPEALLGRVESQLARGQELESALSEVEALGMDETLSGPTRAHQQLVQGRLLAAMGRHVEARRLLESGAKGLRAYESLVALGASRRAVGDMDAAQEAYEQALKLRPEGEEAKVGLGRVLVDRDQEREALSRLGTGGTREAALVRAVAHGRLGDWKRARAELARTRVGGRYPAEAHAWLALADAAEGQAEQARAALERALASKKRASGGMRMALGRVYWQQSALDKAEEQLTQAMQEEARDYEAACALGRLWLARGEAEKALEPLRRAVERNGSHGEAREALGRTLLALGHTDEAVKQYAAWQLDSPGAAAAHEGHALALYHAGKMKEAEAAAGRAVKLAPDDAEAYRIRARILFALGDTPGGFGALERSNRLNAKSAETFCEIAHAFLRQGIVVNAAKAFEAARREGPRVPCGHVGEHHVKPTGGRAAAKALEEIAAQASTVWDKAFAEATRARVLLEAGVLKEARAAADEAVRLAPFSGRSHLALGLVAQKQKRKDAALAKAELTRAVELEPVDGLAHLALADALANEPAEVSRAVSEYETFLRLAGASPEAGRVKRELPALQRRAVR